MQAKVVLPADPLIECSDFCRLIADALYPTGEQILHGIDCIVGKQVDIRSTAPQGASSGMFMANVQPDLLGGQFGDQMLSPGTSGLFQTIPAEPEQLTLLVDEQELSLPYRLTDDDSRFLKSVFPKMPPLRHPMTAIDAADFLTAWGNLPNRPKWTPILITVSMIEQRKKEHEAIVLAHQRRLQSDLDHGRIISVSAEHAPVTRLAPGCFISRSQAIEYLDRIAVSHGGTSGASPSPLGTTDIPEVSVPKEAKKPSRVGDPKLSDEERREMVEFSIRLEAEGEKAHRQIVAKKYGVSTKTVANEVKKARALLRVDHMLTDNRK